MPERIGLENITIVLQRPRYPENIGAAARAMCNMGIRHLSIVKPENCDLTRMLKMATHVGADIIEEMEVFDNLHAALAGSQYVVGTTARLGKQRLVIRSPAELAEKLVPISQKNRIAILFGPEDRGLTNEDLRNCHLLVNIPTAEFASLNLAQAVMIVCYDLFRCGNPSPQPHAPRLATRHELDGMYDQLKDVLVRISFINPENPDYWMNNLRKFFNRLPLRAGEVSIIRGICRQIDWYAKKNFQDGLHEGKQTDTDGKTG